jgi:enoyl-CoA hydratase
MILNITAAITDLNQDRAIKVIVIRSRLEKVFCAGADIKEFVKRDLSTYPENIAFRRTENVFRHHHKPVVAVVQGRALGGGFELALLSDVILCSEKAQFGLPEITLGLIPGLGGTQILPRIVGDKVAKRMILTGLPIDAKEAHRLNVAHLLPTEGFE